MRMGRSTCCWAGEGREGGREGRVGGGEGGLE